MRDLTKSSLILNEKEIIEKTIKGSIPVPDYWYTSLYIKKLFNYYYEQNEQKIADKICEVLKVQKIGFKVDGIKKEVEKLVKHAKERFTPLHNIQEPLKIYASEVEAIKQLEKDTTRQMAFSILMLAKINEYKGYKKDVINYNPNALAKYVEVDSGVVCDALYEMHQAGIITIPLIDYGLHCNIIADNGEVVYKIKDNFDTCKEHFKLIFEDIILEIPVDSNEFTIHYGYKTINKVRKQQGKKSVGTSNIRSALQFKRMALGDSYWVKITEPIANDIDKQMLVANKIRQMARSYKKRSKEDLIMEITEFVEQLS